MSRDADWAMDILDDTDGAIPTFTRAKKPSKKNTPNLMINAEYQYAGWG